MWIKVRDKIYTVICDIFLLHYHCTTRLYLNKRVSCKKVEGERETILNDLSEEVALSYFDKLVNALKTDA